MQNDDRQTTNDEQPVDLRCRGGGQGSSERANAIMMGSDLKESASMSRHEE